MQELNPALQKQCFSNGQHLLIPINLHIITVLDECPEELPIYLDIQARGLFLQPDHRVNKQHGGVEREAPELAIHADGVAWEEDGRLALGADPVRHLPMHQQLLPATKQLLLHIHPLIRPDLILLQRDLQTILVFNLEHQGCHIQLQHLILPPPYLTPTRLGRQHKPQRPHILPAP